MNRKVALIFGITGQDGSTLADLLLEKGYEVHGVIRRASNFNTQRIDHIFNKLKLHYGDLTDAGNVHSLISSIRPSEIYNFAAMSHVAVSFELEKYTFETNTLGVLYILQAVRSLGLQYETKIYQASTSEMFGNVTDGSLLLNEQSPMLPVSPYGVSKLASHHICNIYREAYDMFIVSSVLLNHESERRGPTFVTKKISDYVGKFKVSKDKKKDIQPLQLGNLDSMRDWGYARDYVEGIYMMMQHHTPDNYTLATGEAHSVREFVELAFKEIGIDVEWHGSGDQEYGVDKETCDILVQVNKKYYRPIDIDHLIGDYSKAQKILGWEPKTSFRDLVKIMVADSCKVAEN